MWRLCFLPGLAACSFQINAAGTAGSNDGSTPDLGASRCWTITDIQLVICPSSPPAGALHIASDHTIDTMIGSECASLEQGSSDVCAVTRESIVIDAGRVLAATGNKPLVLIALGSIDLQGTLDVASHSGGPNGPASDGSGCDSGALPTGAGGGQGGSLGTQGGDGGDSSKGLAGQILPIVTLRGGCPGSVGAGSSRPAGRGGGAVALLAPTISLGGNAAINASGAGGAGANTSTNGGSGGGSGGMIVLQATTFGVAPTSQIFANGGGGGGASGSIGGGGSGSDPSDPLTAAPGGSGGGGISAQGGDGGGGYPSSSKTGADNDGGGGGGGGGGVIKIDGASALSSGSVSPPPS